MIATQPSKPVVRPRGKPPRPWWDYEEEPSCLYGGCGCQLYEDCDRCRPPFQGEEKEAYEKEKLHAAVAAAARPSKRRAEAPLEGTRSPKLQRVASPANNGSPSGSASSSPAGLSGARPTTTSSPSSSSGSSPSLPLQASPQPQETSPTSVEHSALCQ